MNRRRVLSGLGAVVGLGVGYGGLRVSDVRPYDPDLPSGDSPRERIVAAAAHRFAVDHRLVSRTRVLRDPLGEAPYDLEVYRQWHQPSRRQHLHALTTADCPLVRADGLTESPSQEFVSPTQTVHSLLHYNRVFDPDDTLPRTLAMHLTDGLLRVDTDAPTPCGTDGGRVASSDVRFSQTEGFAGAQVTDVGTVFAARIRPHRTEWTRVDEMAETVTYRVAGADDYAQVNYPTLPLA